MIFVFGNSNAGFFTDTDPGANDVKIANKFTSYNANYRNSQYKHVLAHKFMERYFDVLEQYVKTSNITSEDYVLLAVGEIDCRWNLPKQMREEGLPARQVVQECLDNHFFPALLKLKESGYNVIGWGNHPVTVKGHTEHHDTCGNPDECINGNELALIWEEELSKRCKENGIVFASILRQLMDDSGNANTKYYSDQHHLHRSARPMMMDKLKEVRVL